MALHADNQTAIASGTSLTATLALAVNAGDLLCAVIRTSDSTPGAGDVADNINGNWTIGAATIGNCSIFYFLGSAAAAANGLTLTVKATTSGSIRISVDRFTGGGTASVVSKVMHSLNQGGLSGDCGTITGDTGGNLLYGGMGVGVTTTTWTAGSSNGVSATIGGQQVAAAGTVMSEYVLSTAAGTQTMTWTRTGSNSNGNGGEITFAFATPARAVVVRQAVNRAAVI